MWSDQPCTPSPATNSCGNSLPACSHNAMRSTGWRHAVDSSEPRAATIWPTTVGSTAAACSQPIRSRHSNALLMKSTECPASANTRSVADGAAARALVRNRQKAKNLPGISWVTGDLAKPETLPAAFEGAKTLFLVSSIGEDTVALQHNAIEAAREAGVTHIVKLSAFGATDHSKAPI